MGETLTLRSADPPDKRFSTALRCVFDTTDADGSKSASLSGDFRATES